MPIRRSPNGFVTSFHTIHRPGLLGLERVVTIPWNRWSPSIGTGGHLGPVRAHMLRWKAETSGESGFFGTALRCPPAHTSRPCRFAGCPTNARLIHHRTGIGPAGNETSCMQSQERLPAAAFVLSVRPETSSSFQYDSAAVWFARGFLKMSLHCSRGKPRLPYGSPHHLEKPDKVPGRTPGRLSLPALDGACF
jgi:hypothetical protein